MKRNTFSTVLFFLLLQTLTAQENMQGYVSVNDKNVEASTQLTYNLLLSSQTVQFGDYLMINLPTTQDISFEMGRAFCTIQSPLTVNQCNVVSPQQAQITYGSGTQGYQLSGSIGFFKNPSSTRTVTDIQFTLFSSIGTQKAVFLSGTIHGFTPTALTVLLSSSSSVVGASGATLKAMVTSSTKIPGTGSLLINFPLYYTNSGPQDQMISTTSPICSGNDLAVLSCYFSPQSRLLTLNYRFNDGNDRYAAVEFLIQSFKNPINPIPKTGFTLTILDSIGNQVAQQLQATLSGVTTPTSFKFVTYQFVDTNLISQYNSFLLNIGMNVPLEQTCFIKIQFPSEFTLDLKFYTMEGTSFFMQSGATSNQIPWTSLDLANRSIVIRGCEYIFGANMLGSITFKKVMNPQYIKESNPFVITLAKDDQFSSIIAQTSSVSVAAADLKAGSISDINISAQNTEVSASTSLLVQFTPSTSLSQSIQNRIIVNLPQSFQLGSSCQITNKSPLLSNSASCTFDASAFAVVINAPFSNSYVAGQKIFLSIASLTNPISVQPYGSFTVSTQVLANGRFYSVDTGTLDNPLQTTAGLAIGLDYVYSSNLVTYSGETTYIFKVSFTHVIPSGGKIRVVIPDNMSIADQSRLQAFCYRLDKSPTPIKLNCVASIQYFDVNLPQGLPAAEAFRLQVVALRNPRVMGQSAMFKIQSYDTQGRLIDETRSEQYFIINMKSVGQMNLVTVTPTNGTTGATTQYGIVINSNTPIFDGDQVSLTFPPEITLPSTSYISCSGNKDYVEIVYCTKVNSNSVNIQLTDVTTIGDGQGFIIYFADILNPPSTRPTNSFTGISLRDLYNSGISQYSNDVTVTLNKNGLIKVFSLKQSTKAPDQQALYTIKFQTNNDLPPSSAIIVRTPSTVFVSRDPSLCYVMTSSMRQNVCSFDDLTTIKITNAFNDQLVNYSGPVEIHFSAVNPSDNADTSQSLSLTIYDDKSFIYKVDEIPTGLNPVFMCNFPCLTCQLNNPSFCLSCPAGQYDPIYLQPDRKTAVPTCVRACNSGYTVSSNSKQSKVCQPCDISCDTCRAGGTPADQNFCTKCSANYPVFWQQNAQCFPTQKGCPIGTYLSNPNRCTTCPYPCIECKNKNVCLRCDPGNPLNLLDRGMCIAKCSPTQTVMQATNGTSYCQNCQAPCKTCQPGLPNNCLTCVDPTKQFLFGNACLSQCPAGTSQNLKTFSCEGCQEGCSLCDSKDQRKCLDCSEGLSLLNGTCYSSCPLTHIKSIDGKVCELRQYPLDNTFVPFPFTFSLALLWAISIVFFFITQKNTQLVQCFIISDAIIIVAATIYQFMQSNSEGQPIVLTMSILIMTLNVIVSLVFGINFTIQVSDYQFNEYKANHKVFYWTVMGLSCLFSLHLFRIFFCKIFNSAVFHANATSPDDFFKPLRLYSLIFIGAVCIPNLSSNIYFLTVAWNGRFWDNQLQMTMFEQLILSFSMSILIIYDRFVLKPKHIVFEAEVNNPYHVKQFESSQRLVQVGSSFNDSAYQPLADKALRHNNLKEILNSVKKNKDLNLNANLDEVMETEMIRRPEKNPTDPDVPVTDLYSSDDEDQFNMSFPGMNPPYQDDGTGRRFELLNWMEEQVELHAEEERVQAKLKEKLNLYLDAHSQYDNQMYDNVYFSPVTKRKLAGAGMQTIEEPRPVPKLHLSQIQQTTNRHKKDMSQQDSMQFKDMSQQDSRKSLFESQKQSIDPKLLKQKSAKKKVSQIMEPANVSPIARQYSRDESEDEILGDEFASDRSLEQQSQKSLKLRDSRGSLVQETLISKSSHKGTIGPETKKWVKRVQLMKTLLLDGTSPRRRPRTPGGHIVEEKRGSGDTAQTLSHKHQETLKEVNIDEETISLGAEHFYKNNKASLDGSDSASSVRTSDLGEPVMKERQDLEAFLREKVTVNNRNFNINEVLGNFPVDSSGQIIGGKEVLWNSNYRDIDAQLVNERGYLINEKTGAIRSRYTYEDLFLPITNSAKDYGELPMPFRWERWNFNPHKIMGNFEYDAKTNKPVFFKNKYGELTDKNYLPVNQSGFLINEKEDIVDNEGHVMFKKAMLTAQGYIPNLLSYQGKSYKIKDIIGQVKKDDVSKEILVRVDQRNGRAVDERGRQVNANGYLIDLHGNIVNQSGEIIFRFWELNFQEPPKIFSFTQFSVDWIKGRVKKGGIQVKDDDLYDLDGRLINTKGYLIDKDDNIVDYYGRIVFRKELLTENSGQDSEIPKVFLSGALQAPQNEDDFFSAVTSNPPNIQISNYDKKQSGRATESEASNLNADTAFGKSFTNNKSDLAKTLNRRGVSIFSCGDGDATVISGPHFSPQKQLDQRKTELIQDLKIKIEPESVDEGPKEEQKKLKRTGTATSGNRKSKKKLDGEEKSRQYAQSRTVRPGTKVISLYQQYIENGNVDQKAFDQGLFTENASGKQVITPVVLPPRTPIVGSRSVGRRNDYTPTITNIATKLQNNVLRFQGTEHRHHSRRENALSPSLLQAGQALSAHGFMSDGQSIKSLERTPNKHVPKIQQNGFFGDSLYSGHNDRNGQGVTSMQSFASKAEMVFQNQNLLRRLDSDIPSLDLELRGGNHIEQQVKQVNNIYGSSIYKRKR